jgi:hypothetical protein
MSGKRASIWPFHAPPRRWITGRPPTPRAGRLAGRRIRRRPSRCPIRPCGPGSSGTPAVLTAASILTSGSRPVRKQARPAARRPRRLPSASPALYAPSAWNYRCGLGISASTVSGAVWSPPTARHCAAGSTRAQSARCGGLEGPGRGNTTCATSRARPGRVNPNWPHSSPLMWLRIQWRRGRSSPLIWPRSLTGTRRVRSWRRDCCGLVRVRARCR